MKKTINSISILLAFTFIIFGVASCNKQLTSASSTSGTITSSTADAILVTASTTSADSIAILQPCPRGFYRDSIDTASLPAAALAYLTSNYTAYSFIKAFEVKDSAGTINGYVAIILFDNKPVGILFDASGNFVRVLEQRQPDDMHNAGWHNGGLFCNRNGLQKDTVAISALPATITTYITNNYPADTLLKAFVNVNSSYAVISQDNGLYATVFAADGSFIKRVVLPAPAGQLHPVAESVLPATVLTYLTTTYPNYVYDRAFVLQSKTSVDGYVVIIDANNTRYAVAFDASGSFVAVKTIY